MTNVTPSPDSLRGSAIAFSDIADLIPVNCLPVLAQRLGRPVTGAFAVHVWEQLSGNRLPGGVARELYRDCGYVPFSGYPLKRAE